MSVETQIRSASPDDGSCGEQEKPPLSATACLPVTVIEPRPGWLPIDLSELWQHRELLFFFAWRDVKIRYKQSELGVAWVLLQPLLSTGIFAVLFRVLLGAGNEPSSSTVPYFLSTFCAMLPWQLFSESVARSGSSVVQNREMVQKIYFPRLVLPVSATLGCVVDFLVALAALFVLMVVYGVVPSLSILTLPLFAMLAVTASLAVGLWLSALAAMYRDFLYVQPFLIRIGMFVSPVIYSVSSIQTKLPDWVLFVYGLNPMAGAIEGFRWALFGDGVVSWIILAPSCLVAVLMFLAGAFYFARMESRVVDVV